MSALVVTADFASADFAWLDALRRTHYPAERNQLPAHLTMFHALPPSALAEAKGLLARLVRRPPPKALVAGLMDLGGGVAMRVTSDELDQLRMEIADHFHGCLSAQDSAGWRPHITIQNKVAPRTARALIAQLSNGFEPRPLAIAGLSIHRYLGGPWEGLANYRFRP